MSKKKAPYRKLIRLKTYTLKDLSKTLAVSEGTIRVGWRKKGLMPISLNRHPLLYEGETVKKFLKKMYDLRKMNNLTTEFFCMKCNYSRNPKNKFIEVFQNSKNRMSIKTKCEICGYAITKHNISIKTLKIMEKTYQVIPLQVVVLSESLKPSGKSRIQPIQNTSESDSYNKNIKLNCYKGTTSGDKSRIQPIQNDLFKEIIE